MKQLMLGSNYSIKVAAREEDDINEIYHLIRESFHHSPLSDISFNHHGMFRLISDFMDPNHIDQMVMILLYHEETLAGFLVAQKNLFLKQLTGKEVASQIVWYVKPEYRTKYSLKLLDAFELWGTLQGCDYLDVAIPKTNKNLKRVYDKRGYQPLEHHYMKEV